MILQDTANKMYLRDDSGQAFSCPADEFAIYEPTYALLPPGWSRFWGGAVQYISNGNTQQSDSLYTPERLAAYLSKIPSYQAAYNAAHPTPPEPPAFWIHYGLTPGGAAEMQADGVPLLKNDAADRLDIVATLRATQDPASPVIPYEPAKKWPIRLRRGDGRQLIVRVAPSAPGVFPFTFRMPGKDSGRFEVDDADFAAVTVSGTTYQIKQSQPLKIDVYEEL